VSACNGGGKNVWSFTSSAPYYVPWAWERVNLILSINNNKKLVVNKRRITEQNKNTTIATTNGRNNNNSNNNASK